MTRRSSLPGSGYRQVIIIDDSRAMRALLRRALETIGFEAVEACDGREALALLEKMRVPELALVDWNMPELDGLELVRTLRKNALYDRMAIVMVTSETDTAQVVRALAAGADEYIMKPFSPEVLMGKLLLLEAPAGAP